MMYKAVIIDDEKHALETLEWKINQFCDGIEIIKKFDDPEIGLAFLNNNKVDLLFLDIEMPSLNGFELLKGIKQIDFDVIFTTAYDEYGIRAIKFSALDYLLKPIQKEELIISIDKFKAKKEKNVLPIQIEALFNNLSRADNASRKIALATKESIELVKPADIILCEADNNYTNVYIKGRRRKMISRTLKDFEEMLSDHNFFRSHQSFLVNIDHIVEYMRHDGGYLIMSNDMKVSVSRSKKEELMKIF